MENGGYNSSSLQQLLQLYQRHDHIYTGLNLFSNDGQSRNCAHMRENSFEPSQLPATVPKIRQHLIFASLGLIFSKSLSVQTLLCLKLLNKVILCSFCSFATVCCYFSRTYLMYTKLNVKSYKEYRFTKKIIW